MKKKLIFIALSIPIWMSCSCIPELFFLSLPPNLTVCRVEVMKAVDPENLAIHEYHKAYEVLQLNVLDYYINGLSKDTIYLINGTNSGDCRDGVGQVKPGDQFILKSRPVDYHADTLQSEEKIIMLHSCRMDKLRVHSDTVSGFIYNEAYSLAMEKHARTQDLKYRLEFKLDRNEQSIPLDEFCQLINNL